MPDSPRPRSSARAEDTGRVAGGLLSGGSRFPWRTRMAGRLPGQPFVDVHFAPGHAPARLLGEDEVERATGLVELLDCGLALLVRRGVAELGDDTHQLARTLEERAGLL